MDEGHKTRIALNRRRNRNVNETMRADGPEHVITVVCECGRLGCNELIGLSRAEYEHVRSNAQRFAIVPGHDVPGVEDVVEHYDGYAVIEKHADVDDVRQVHGPAPVARTLSRRSKGVRENGTETPADTQPPRRWTREGAWHTGAAALGEAFDIAPDASDERSQRRIALHQATLRRVNEAMRADGARHVAVRCECGQIGCNELIWRSGDEYETVRGHPRRFALAPGHEITEVDEPVERHDRYIVVEARAGAAADVADTTDPRARRG